MDIDFADLLNVLSFCEPKNCQIIAKICLCVQYLMNIKPLKGQEKNASENVMCWSPLLQIIA